MGHLVSIFALALTACVTAPQIAQLSRDEADAVCAMAQDVKWQPFGTVTWESEPQRIAELNAVASNDEFRQLPTQIRCVGKRITLNRKDGIPFDKFWISSDGKGAAISGGWIGGELLGEGGICYFSRSAEKWVRRGCTSAWAV